MLTWSTYCISLLVGHLTEGETAEPPSPELANIGYYVRYGVNNPLSVFIRDELDWGSREDALALGKLHTSEIEYFSNKVLFRAVLNSVGDETLFDILGSREKVRNLIASM